MDNIFGSATLKSLSDSERSQTSQSRSKRLYIFLGLLIAIFVISTAVLAIVLATRTTKTKETTVDTGKDVCITPYCVRAANYLLESIDDTVEPCVDFYSFVCGTWIKNTRIPDDTGVANTFNGLRNQLDYNIVDILTSSSTKSNEELKAVINARTLYRSCVDEQKIETDDIDSIVSVINKELGGWPILQGASWNDSSFNLFNVLLKLREYNNNIFYNMGTSVDEKNSAQYDIEIGQSDLGLGQRDNYFNESKLTTAYKEFIRDLAMLLSTDPTMVEQDVNNIFQFEKDIAAHHWTSAEQQARENETVRTTIGNLSMILNTNFDFTNYIIQAYKYGNVDISDSDIVMVDELDYLHNVSLMVDQAPPRVVQNYVVWRFLMHRVDNMPQRFRTIKEKFDRILRGTTAERPRTVICGSYVNGNMGFAVSKLYIQRYFDENARNQSFEMIGNIRKSFIGMVQESTWMDNKSRDSAVEKAQAIDEKIGYPDYLASADTTQLEEQYAKYVFNASYMDNVLKLLRIKAQEDFQILRKPVDRKAWGFSPPTIVNAFYAPSKNQITFPAGILQMPFFDKDAPKYLNYGGIGAVIGHEITHGFDNTGRQFDKDGNRIPWWTAETIEKFDERKTCIVNQYSNYTITQINTKSNGKRTQGEDIADNGGIRESFFAYQKWAQSNKDADKKLPGLTKYSPEQLFFINYAHTWCSKMTDSYIRNRVLPDVHSFGQFRVIGPTSNFVEFDRVFECKPGQGNSRVDKCIVW